MQTNINGGGSGVSANTGSSIKAMDYLDHERQERLDKGETIKATDCQGMRFTHDGEGISANDAADLIDTNRKGLHKDDAKFFMLDVNPSKEEQEKMFQGCKTDRQREKVFQDYVRHTYMEAYANNFKGYKDRQTGRERQLHADDLVYVASIHKDRRTHKGEPEQWHAHIVVSRETKNCEYKISPQAKNRKQNGKGPVKAAFDRQNFYKSVESTFDRRFKYDRKPEETFEYKKNAKQQRIAETAELHTLNADDDKRKAHLSAIEAHALKAYESRKQEYMKEAERREALRRKEWERQKQQRQQEQQRRSNKGIHL